jgi:ABC-type transporter Mla subunit MlaD/biopolymer transport protein ExbB/TolQ
MLDFLSTGTSFSKMIIIGTFFLILVITIRVVMQNISIYRHAKRELDMTYHNLDRSDFWKELIQRYDIENKHDDQHVEVQAFVESFMANYSTKYGSRSMLSHINSIHSTSSTVILIGVLGTFVGLISALYGLDLQGDAFQNSIQHVLDGMFTAFYTSVFGIVSSLIVSFVHKNWDAKHVLLQLTLRAENLLHTYAKHTWEGRIVDSLVKVKDAIEEMHSSLQELDQFSETMEQTSENMRAYNEKFAESATILHGIFDNMETVGENFNKRMDNLNDYFNQLVSQFNNQEQVLKSIDDSIQHLTGDIKHFVDETSEHIEALGKDNKFYFENTTKKLTESFKGLADFYSQHTKQLDRIVQDVSQLEKKNQDYIVHIKKATETIKEVLTDRTFDQLMNVTKKFTDNVILLENHFGRLQDQYDRLDKEKHEFMHIYSSQKEELSRIRDEINKFTSTNEGIRRQFEDIKYVYEQAERSNRELIQHAYDLTREVKEALKQSSGEQANQLKQVMYDLQNQLNDSFRNLDAIMAKNLSNTISQFEQYIHGTNQAIERQFQAVNEFVQNNVKTNNAINRDVLNSVDDIRGRIHQWDMQLRNSMRTHPQREYIE